MHNPKEEIFAALNALGHYCSFGNEAVFAKVPAVTFTVGSNEPLYNLDSDIDASDIEVIVNIYTESLEDEDAIVAEAEAAMREIGYLCTYSADLPRPEGALYHYQLRFSAIK